MFIEQLSGASVFFWRRRPYFYVLRVLWFYILKNERFCGKLKIAKRIK